MKSSPKKSDPSAVGTMIPLLAVYDMPRAVAFYRDVLGFDIETKWEPDGHLYWAKLKCGDTRLMLNAEHEDGERRPEHDRPHGKNVTFYFYPADVVVLRESIVRRGGKATAFVVTFYGHKQFTVRDADGYTLCFSQETAEAPTDGEG